MAAREGWIDTPERCGTCSHDGWMHRAEKLRYAWSACVAGDCRCEAFVPSGVYACEDRIKGDLRSPRGTNQNAECAHAAVLVVTIPDVGPFHVCGVHARRWKNTGWEKKTLEKPSGKAKAGR